MTTSETELTRRLRRVRRRTWLLGTLRILGPAGAVTGAVVGTVLLLVDRSLVPYIVGTGAGVLLALTLGVATLSRRSQGPLARTARRVDREANLRGASEAYLDLPPHGRRNAVQARLAATLPDWIERIRPTVLVPMRPGRTLLAVAPAWIAVGLAAAWSPELLRTHDPVAGEPAPRSVAYERMASEPDRDVVVRQLERLTHLLGEETRRSQDPAMRALFDEADRLRERIAHGETPTAETWTTLASLTERTARSMGVADDPTFKFGDGAGDAEVGADARPATARDRPDPIPDDGRREGPIDAMDAPDDGERVLDGLLDRMETSAIARAAPDPDEDLSDVSTRRAESPTDQGTYFDDPAHEAAARAALDTAAATTASERGGDVVGDGVETGGDQAGGGTIGLDEGRSGRPLGDLDLTEDALSLPDVGDLDGRRLHVRAAPPGGAHGEGIASPDGVHAEWIRIGEAFQGVDRVPSFARGSVAAFHAPMRDGATP